MPSVILLAAVVLGAAAAQELPRINVDGVIPNQPGIRRPLKPGIEVSIYGQHLGPKTGCTSGAGGWSDVKQLCELDIHLTPLPDFCRIIAFWDVSLGGGSALAVDHGGVGGGSRGYRLLNEAEEQHSSAFRSPPIKP